MTSDETVKVLAAGFVPPYVREAIQKIADEEGRTFSNALCRLLEEHPRIKKLSGRPRNSKRHEK